MRGKWGEGELTFKQWHHAYLGLILRFVALYFRSTILYGIASVILWDDLLQHYIQWRWDNSYQSPLKYLYIKWIWEPLYAHKDI